MTKWAPESYSNTHFAIGCNAQPVECHQMRQDLRRAPSASHVAIRPKLPARSQFTRFGGHSTSPQGFRR